MKKNVSILMLLGCSMSLFAQSQKQPNVIFILADDIGYGDFSCYGGDQKVKTPALDALAHQGARFTNAYAPAATSSPSRYALLTGEYAFRKHVSILSADAPLCIAKSTYTLPQMFKEAGYRTGIVGKWHLGLGTKGQVVDFNKSILDGPLRVGFDYAYYFPATNDRVPTIFIENDKVVGLEADDPITISYKKKVGNLPTGKENPSLLRMTYIRGHKGTIVNGVSRIGWMSGGKNTVWRDEDMTAGSYQKAINFIEKQSNKPFFLYYAPHNAHEPRIPSEAFRGHSQAGIYGDLIEEFDYYIGCLVKELKQQNLFENTIIIVSSDNGPMIKEGYNDGALENINGHDPFNGLRGEKYSLHEGGVRVPFIVSWPAQIKKPFIQDQPFCYADMLSTYAGLLNFPLTKAQRKDSKNGAALFLNQNVPNYRKYVIVQNNTGEIAVRAGKWKYIPVQKGVQSSLYNLAIDPAEMHDMQFSFEQKRKEFEAWWKKQNK